MLSNTSDRKKIDEKKRIKKRRERKNEFQTDDSDLPKPKCDINIASADSGNESLINEDELEDPQRLKNNPLVPMLSTDSDDTDSSDEEDLRNTIGNVPVRWYENYEHVGYDWSGRPIEKVASSKRNEIDDFLAKMEDPDYWRKVKDRQRGGEIRLSDEQVQQIAAVKRGSYPQIGYNPYEPYVDYFTSDVMKTSLQTRPDHKRSFIPSQLDTKKVGRLVHAMKMGWIRPQDWEKLGKKRFDEEDNFAHVTYDIWGDQDDSHKSRSELARLRMRIPALKLPPPTHAESYNPPQEYLLNEDEKEKRKEEGDKEKEFDFEPQKFSCLRQVPGYTKLITERYQRCLDLYLAPRQRKLKLNIKSASELLPPIPKPQDLQPFPQKLSLVFPNIHKAEIVSLCVEPVHGNHVASASEDGVIIIWNISLAMPVHKIELRKQLKLNNECKLKSISWSPSRRYCTIAAAIGHEIIILNAKVGPNIAATEKFLYNISKTEIQELTGQVCSWSFLSADDNRFIRARISLKYNVIKVSWHYGGDYLASVLDAQAGAQSVVLHQLTKKHSQAPFSKRQKGEVRQAEFHRSKPWLFVTTKEHVRIYDLGKQTLIKKLNTNCKPIQAVAIHPYSDNMLVAGGDARVSWMDLDLSSTPYKTLKHHHNAVEDVAFHERLPLFATASADSRVLICHANVYSDLMKNALIVPVKTLSAGSTTQALRCVFHPRLPWLLVAGDDRLIKLFVY